MMWDIEIWQNNGYSILHIKLPSTKICWRIIPFPPSFYWLIWLVFYRIESNESIRYIIQTADDVYFTVLSNWNYMLKYWSLRRSKKVIPRTFFWYFIQSTNNNVSAHWKYNYRSFLSRNMRRRKGALYCCSYGLCSYLVICFL